MNVAVIGSSVQGKPVVYVAGFLVLVLLAFARPWMEGLVRLVQLGGLMVAAVLLGAGVTSFKIVESEKGPPGGSIELDRAPGIGVFVIGVLGFLAPPLLGLAGVHLLLSGRAWSLLWVVLVLLFVAYLKAKDLFTTVVVVLAGAAIGWTVTRGNPGQQAMVAVAVVWLLLLGGVSTLFGLRRVPPKPESAEQATTSFIPGFLGLALFWSVSILALWVGGRRLLGV